LEIFGQEKDFFAKKSTGIGMKISKGKHRFIKNNVTGYIYSTSFDIKTFDSFVHGAIPKEYTLL
jgi:hypothetical protein